MIPCTHCARQFTNQDAYDQHRNAAHNIVHDCKLCDRKFPLTPAFFKHIHEMHFFCPTCTEYFDAKAKLDYHVESVYCRRNTLPCKGCNSTFQSENDLLEHMKSKGHGSKIMKFRCGGCPAGFASDSALREHQKAKNHGTNPPNDSNHQCKECTVFFRTYNNLQEHLKATRHGDSATVASRSTRSVVSSQSTITPSSLAKVVQQTSGTRCQECLATFDTYAAWNSHNTAVHVSVCELCDARFRGPVALYQHQQTTHQVRCKCGFTCDNTTQLSAHTAAEHSMKCPK
jgi:hypothetical protein